MYSKTTLVTPNVIGEPDHASNCQMQNTLPDISQPLVEQYRNSMVIIIFKKKA
jgi:hypothetical protein